MKNSGRPNLLPRDGNRKLTRVRSVSPEFEISGVTKGDFAS